VGLWSILITQAHHTPEESIMKYFYTIFTQVRDGLQEYVITDNMKQAMAARAQGVTVFVGFSSNFPGTKRF
jgi:hypothetical protein